MSRRRNLALFGTAVGAGGAFAIRQAVRSWERAHDVTGGQPLSLPDGEDHVVVTRDGAKLEVRVTGPADAARTVVLAHCWTGDRRVWGPVAQRLVDRGNRVVLWNHRGHGGSTNGDDGYTLEALGDDVRAVLEHLDLHGVVLAGHSMGGMASMAFLTAHPDAAARVAALGLVATSAGGLSRGRFADAIARRAVGFAADRSLRSHRLGNLFVRNAVGRGAVRAHLDAVRETFLATPPEVRSDFLGAMFGMDLVESLHTVDLPSVIVVGTRDTLTPPRHARRLADAIPGARLEVLPDAGHMLPIERPDEVAEALSAVS